MFQDFEKQKHREPTSKPDQSYITHDYIFKFILYKFDARIWHSQLLCSYVLVTSLISSSRHVLVFHLSGSRIDSVQCWTIVYFIYIICIYIATTSVSNASIAHRHKGHNLDWSVNSGVCSTIHCPLVTTSRQEDWGG